MYKSADDLMLSQKATDNATSQLFTERNEVFPRSTVSEESIHNHLHILSLACDALCSFYYQFPQPRFFVNGDSSLCDEIEMHDVLTHLRKSPSKLKLLTNQHERLGGLKKHQILAMNMVDESGASLGVIGTVFSLFRQSKRRLRSQNNEVALQISSQTKKLLSLLMLKFEDEQRIHQKQYSLQAIHSQHLQISALNQDYICIKDSAHRLVYANPALVNTYPLKVQNKILGRSHIDFYMPQASAQITDSDITALSTGFYNGNLKVMMANKQEKILQISKKVFFGIDGKKYLMSVSRDVTEKEVLINDLTRSNADLDNFAYVASHDLRSPINVIKRLVTWVKEDCDAILPNESKEDLDIVLSRVERMEKLLLDLLNYSRIGKDYKESIIINLHEFVVELLSLIDLPMGFAMKCDDINITVPEIPFNVVMLNLVSNAIKHNDSGNAKIEIRAKQNDKGCTISVLDNGPGIAEKNRERIFELFETLKPKDEVEGSGMGLSVVKKIVQHYGGNIKVEANTPRGTKFIVYWPRTNMARYVLDNLKKQSTP